MKKISISFICFIISFLTILSGCGKKKEKNDTTLPTIETQTRTSNVTYEDSTTSTTITEITTTMPPTFTTKTVVPITTAKTASKPLITTKATTSPVSAEISDYEKKVIELVNDHRLKAGLSILKSDLSELQKAAGYRAIEIKTKFSHTRPNGSSYSTILNEFNIANRASGENIAAGQRSPEEVVTAWMNSEGHKKNILNANFTHIGVGNDGTSWVQLFIRK